MIDGRVTEALTMLAEGLNDAQDPWWIIGSVAVALHGGDPGRIADVDVMVSRRDLDAMYERLPLTNTPEEGKPMFLSERFGRWAELPLNVEFMAGLTLLEQGAWLPITLQTRQSVAVGDTVVFVPEKPELIALLHRFGRDKDLARAATL